MSARPTVPRSAMTLVFAGLMALALSACGEDGDTAAESAGEVAVVGEPTEAAATQDAADASDESDSDDASALPDPCALLTPAEIESAAGFAVDGGVADADRQSDTKVLCEWTQTGGGGFVAIAVAPGYPVPFGEGETVVGTTVAIDIGGASEAFSIVSYGSVAMRVDGDYMVVSSAGSTSSESADVTVALATLVASRYSG